MNSPLPLEEALASLLAMAVRLPVEQVGVEAARGRFLAENLIARRTQPAADLSAMDGYAVAGTVRPWRIVGESAAGHPFAGSVRMGEAVRIATGALVPDGADRVLIQEDCARTNGQVALMGEPGGERHIRQRGADFAEGAALLSAGALIGPVQIALALAAGHVDLAVHRRPRVAILDSGDELARPGATLALHHIPASNGAMLAALVGDLPCVVDRIGPVPDDLPSLVAALAAAGEADVIVTSGGASVGDHDLMQPALAEYGAETAFWRVAIKPGKPLLVARKGAQIILSLPGNPAASFVTAYFFLLPLVRALSGAAAPRPLPVAAVLAQDLPGNGARRSFVRGVWDGVAAVPAGPDDSGALHGLAASNCLIDREPHAPLARAGDQVRIWPFAPAMMGRNAFGNANT